ncbi:MAG: hypothetical protein PWP23_2658 [Candidatus Sumerlaeota bacterium]|nr:hypothetical protein [Candidatus Sumerlaeota bacterium]
MIGGGIVPNFGIGMIGCGVRGRGVVKSLLDQHKDIKVVAVSDPSDESISQARREIAPSAKVYADYKDLVQDPAVGWVMVASPNCLHRDHVIAALNAGKHVWCEKPLATTLQDCLDMKKAWKASGRLFSLGFTLRYSPHYLKINELLRENTIGDIISVEFNETLDFNHGGYIMSDWRRDSQLSGGHLLEKCSHDIDIANWLLRSRPRRVAGFGGLDFFKPENLHFQAEIDKSPEGHTPYQSWPSTTGLNPFTAEKDIYDNQVAILEFENGVRGTFHTNCNAGIPERRLYLLGTTGAIRADVLTGKIELRKIGFDAVSTDVSTDVSGGHGGGDTHLVRNLADSILNSAAPHTGIDDGLVSSFTCFAIDEASRTGQVVEMDKYWKQADI